MPMVYRDGDRYYCREVVEYNGEKKRIYGKSAIGMMSLGTDSTMRVHFISDDSEAEKQFRDDISKYIVE